MIYFAINKFWAQTTFLDNTIKDKDVLSHVVYYGNKFAIWLRKYCVLK